MPEVDLRITAEQASQQAAAMMRKQKHQRRVPKLAPRLQQLSDAEKVYIHNVGPWPCTRELGSWGSFTVPACPEGKRWASMAPIPGIFTEPIPITEKEFKLDEYEGSYVANQILGIGSHTPKSASFVRLGCFQSPNERPTAEELKAANDALDGYAKQLFKEGITAHNKGPKEAEMVIGDKHMWAAIRTNNPDAPFLKQYSPESRQECPNCGTMSKTGVVTCAQCRYIFDEKRYAAMKSRIASN